MLRILIIVCILCSSVINASELKIGDYFANSDFAHFKINPSGELIAYSESLANEYNIFIIQKGSKTKHLIHTAERYTTESRKYERYIKWIEHNNRVASLTWLGNSTLAIKENTKDGFRRYKILKLSTSRKKTKVTDITYLNQNGYWLNPLVTSEKVALFAKYISNDDIGYHVDLFRLNLTKSNLDGQTSNKKKLNKKGEKLQYWITDDKGYRAAGIRRFEGKPELYVRTGHKPSKYRWLRAWTGDKGDSMSPAFFDRKANKLAVLTNHQSDKKQLRWFDIETNQLSDVIYKNEKYDVTSSILSADKTELVGAFFKEKGYYKQAFFSQEYKEKQKTVSQQLGTDNFYLKSPFGKDGSTLVEASQSNNPGEIFLYSNTDNTVSSIQVLRPWIDNSKLHQTKTMAVEIDKDTSIEAFITLPKDNAEKSPLVVIPHGGPIGVSDSRYYSADVQVLASHGFATLQVNYRGSSGYGKSFKQQGMEQWGKLIEDDIEAALHQAINNYSIDKNRVCIVGGSYGGYSAIISLIRSPDLYQCGASFAGVTDLSLLFQRSDIENNPVTKELLSSYVGDPTKDQDKLFAQSPIYRAQEISRPLMLSHGTNDEIVDIEHAYRLRFALRKAKKPFEWHVLDGVTHGFDTTDQAEQYYSKLIAFLNKHLMQQ